jgi:hypothetical protein
MRFEPGELARFLGLDQAVRHELGPAAPHARGARDPLDHLQVAQAAGGLLEIRLKRVGRVLVLGVPLLLLELLRLEKADRIEHARALQPLEERLRADQEARFEQRGADRNVARRRFHAAFHRAHAMPDFQADIPEPPDQALERLALRGARLLAEEHQEVDVGAREELAATVAAGGDERRLGGDAALAPRRFHDPVDERGMAREQGVRVGALQVLMLERLPLGRDLGAQIELHGGAAVPFERVRTSKPLSVTATVCSHCADRLWSLVTMVQPSASSRMPALPALIIGSMVNVMPGSSTTPTPGLP